MSNEANLIQTEAQMDQAVRAVAVIENKEAQAPNTPMEIVEQNVSDFLEKAYVCFMDLLIPARNNKINPL